MEFFSDWLRCLGGDDGAFPHGSSLTSRRWGPSLEVLEGRSSLSSSPLGLGAASPCAVLGVNGGRIANAASAAYAALPPTQSFGDLIRSATITSTGGINVIRVHSLNYDRNTLTLQGGANDVFIFNILGDFSFNHSTIQLRGGVTADHVLFNFVQPGPGEPRERGERDQRHLPGAAA